MMLLSSVRAENFFDETSERKLMVPFVTGQPANKQLSLALLIALIACHLIAPRPIFRAVAL